MARNKDLQVINGIDKNWSLNFDTDLGNVRNCAAANISG